LQPYWLHASNNNCIIGHSLQIRWTLNATHYYHELKTSWIIECIGTLKFSFGFYFKQIIYVMELDEKTIKLQIVNVSSHFPYVLDHITWYCTWWIILTWFVSHIMIMASSLCRYVFWVLANIMIESFKCSLKCNWNSRHIFLSNGFLKNLGGLLYIYLHPTLGAWWR
jgi:hypothetical protein